ncbi:MAG: SirA family protein [Candidatus Sedimenticola endophacoides]|uniref:SirA family protein n=1 Tax=Candidatus Sedimenticola endophacoides TaxID=2548426 RepID=A0A6N4E6C7_9GAMM|nr:MAG: SirA family protein [Candidatus Sedimenticola endophacoides]OQX33660.1 MAG: SirA family protein [Candidatus Sedimenticola endophacoides]OQX41068.1 MAG: SirA family protein [Candidatus Sedimenticola endophacoides]OQX43374.1 MAG: SirA family protein [Candidatus Sedimenticola endophacoides]OQX48374.1 MAG: SirA family protein [Candidatus Sedimenticola endophacoides]
MSGRVIVDCQRLLCPMPVIRVQDVVRTLAPGSLVEARCSDPGALHDIPAWCRINGHRVLATRTTADDEYIVVVEVGEAE